MARPLPIDIVIPTYRRPDNMRRCWDNLERYRQYITFVCHESDESSQQLCVDLGANLLIDIQPPSGVNATNAGYQGTTREWCVISQDDIVFDDNWLEEAFLAARGGAEVIGLNDCFPGRTETEHSVAWLVHRPYVEARSLAIGTDNCIFFPGYHKNYADNELNDTAKARGVWAYATFSLAEHLHPGVNKSELDDTYRNNEQFCGADYETYMSRRSLWS